ncbi:hypothetical protein [uncultured Chryseobacterium sp.]|uniref:hypothetical protein n=1 Tax=uncultured Chryseobacterium sp. TaxID=259322 RepID=UPI002602283E|nr:hypothetical protein [uncultured Chryseobacterium sp.]
MRKKLIFAILGFLIFVIACRNEETFKNHETQKQELISKSLWKEDMVYIKNVKKVFEVNFNEDKFYQDFGEVAWNYAMTFGNFDESFLRVPIIKDDKVVSTMQVVRNKETDKVFFSHTEDSESINFFQNLLFSKRPLKPLKDSAYPNSNPTGRAYWQSITTCSTRTLYVGCVSSGSTSTDCVPMYKTTTTCTTTYVFINDYSDDPRGGYNPPDGYKYDGTRPRITDDETEAPCDKIKERQVDTKYTEKFEHLNTNEVLSMNRERGFFERQSPPANNLGSSFLQLDGQDGTTGLSLPANLDGIIGLLHSHNDKDGVIKIFSPTDVRTFINHFLRQSNNYTGSYSNAYSTVVTSEGSYTLKYSKTTHPGGINFDTFSNWEKWYEKQFTNLLNDGQLTQVNVEKLFTQFMKEVVNIDGLELYKVTKDSSTKMEYDGKNNPVKKTDCPQ